MVSPAPLAAANPPPPLSYAERAKKAAQNARPPPQVAPQRSISQGASSSTASSTAPPAPTSAPPRPAALASPPTAPKASRSGHSTAGDALAPPATSHPPPASSSQPATPPAADPAAEPKPNGDVNHNGDSASVAAVPSPPVQKQASAPPVNVWNIRKEQMAARVLNQPRPTNSTSPLPNQNSAAAAAVSPPQSSALDASTLPASVSSTSPNPSMKPSPTVAPINGHLPPSAELDDPFVVRAGRTPPKPSPPAIDDAESWPEVGQAAATPPHASNGRADMRSKEGDEEKTHEREVSQGHGSRKSEKTKWVPIPPEELQFERPARTQHQRHRPPPHADRNNPRQSGGPSGTASTSSGQGSQQQSRTHSASGMRPPPSHTGSVSHSQAQSRTGSVHSSPRHSSVRGGGRRLPEEGGAPGMGASRSMRSSGPNSPATYAQPQPLPPPEFIPSARPPFINTNVAQPGRDPNVLSTIPDSGAAEVPPPGAYYPPPPGPPMGVSPYHSPRPAGSPAPNPYALPPMVYPGQPGIPAPVPVPGYGTPPYPMYPPYPYYGQPYMYWPPPPPGMPTASPSAHPAQPSDVGVPPPTMMARPPPPSESEAVAGYRDVGFTLPPPVAEHSQSQQSEGEGVERGRRTRELSFGTIAVEGAKSPAPGSPSAGAGTGVGAAAGGAALGLDVEGAKAAGAESQPAEDKDGGDGEKADGKSFTVFSIGVAPGEPGPARLRSRTRTQSKGAAAAVEAPVKEEEGAAAESDAVAVLADVAAKVIDLTDPETKWEFGTTKQAEEAAGAADAAAGADAGVPAAPVADAQNVDMGSVPPPIPGAPFVPIVAPYAAVPPYVPPVVIPGAPVNGMPTAPSPSAYAPRPPQSATETDEWEVRDYGYGFGRGGPPSAYPPRDDRPFRERREFVPQNERENFGRPRRGSYGQGGYDRGSYGGRRGRGLSGGYGGRGYSNRSFSGGRGGYSNQGQPRQPAYVPPPPPQPEVNGYYAPPIAPMATYIPSPYESYPYAAFPPPPPPPQMVGSQGSPSAPLPVPQSQLLFPLDSTRYYLLGQLEYYLSTQNMAQDFFLRQQMDSRGWIPISLIASFRRVQSLTMDPQLVTDVLTLSSLVEVRDGYVRMRQWQQFVLPTAHKSRVEPDDGSQPTADPSAATASQDGAEHRQAAEGEHHTAQQNHDGDEDEEEDVEFVL
ncbi:hypothetical protein OH77DRAFT_692424 [Trametes cingulata]|nr:hypothetical protein OH77DRAFT_692424 [Trametes cingulata]